jgi:uncharacterized C2H2 Zn-finger protein
MPEPAYTCPLCGTVVTNEKDRDQHLQATGHYVDIHDPRNLSGNTKQSNNERRFTKKDYLP